MAGQLLTYTIAIRTLGLAGDKFREELLSITRQAVQPERVVVYIAEGYERPRFTVGREEYVYVRKGMMAQRVLPYDDIASDCLLMLDDDVRLAPDSAERLLRALAENKADCVAADTFRNHEMPLRGKVLAALSNLVFPHRGSAWAFKMHRNGSFSYINNPVKSFYWSQTCAGPAMMWRLDAYRQVHLKDELWLDDLGFFYGEDALLSYKLHKNGFRLGVLFDSGIENLDGATASGAFRKGIDWMYVRTFASFAIWWRTLYRPGDTSFCDRMLTAACWLLKALWLLGVVSVAAVLAFRLSMPVQYLRGITDAWRYVHTDEFMALRSYVIKR